MGRGDAVMRRRAGACRAGQGFFLSPVRRVDAPLEGPRCGGGGRAYWVGPGDGRYFPLAGSENGSGAASCTIFCPASETKVVYGSGIDNGATETGKPYSNCRMRSAIATRS